MESSLDEKQEQKSIDSEEFTMKSKTMFFMHDGIQRIDNLEWNGVGTNGIVNVNGSGRTMSAENIIEKWDLFNTKN